MTITAHCFLQRQQPYAQAQPTSRAPAPLSRPATSTTTATGITDPLETADWQLFIDRRTLPQKAGCEPGQIGRVLIKELTDNGLDNGATSVTLSGDARRITVTDTGPGLDRATILRVFAVNRPLLTSKRQRLPTRGMLGNGLRVVMGAVAAYGGTISVTSEDRTYDLAVDTITGSTRLTAERMAAPQPGLLVTVTFAQTMFSHRDFAFGRLTIDLAQLTARPYTGLSQLSWYSPAALAQLLAAARDVPPARVIDEIFGVTDPTAQASTAWAGDFIARYPAPRSQDIGYLGQGAFDGYYQMVDGRAVIDNATIPFCVEAWVTAERADRNSGNIGAYVIPPLINRSPALAQLYQHADGGGIRLYGCGIDIKVKGKRAKYTIELSVITPYIQLTGDGKSPYLGPFAAAIDGAVRQAAGRAYRNLVHPETTISVADAAKRVMRQAYMKASDNNTLPAKARQLMYAARPLILELTRRETFSDTYFTQVLLPNYIRDYPDETADWDVVYDARGHLTEPHTGRSVPLGTVAVREYLGLRPGRPGHPHVAASTMYPTNGPEHRYGNVLFVEKEGFDELFEAVRLHERYDIAIMSTKGMSVVAARRLLDQLAPLVDNILVLHDFDVAGFSIFGTLGTDSRRYEFTNDLSGKIIDIGLRLDNVDAMDLQSETVKVDDREARRETLYNHGATDAEVDFLLPDDDGEPCRRVELNAMTSRQLVDLVETALDAYGVEKVIPDRAVLEQHARHQLETKYASDLIAEHARTIATRAASATLPSDLEDQIAALLDDESALYWDQAVAQIIASQRPQPSPPAVPTGRFGFRRGD